MILSLQEFLRRKKESDEVTTSVDWGARRDAFLRDLDGLYRSIGEWLEPAIQEGTLTLTRQPTKLSEEHVGSYDADSLLLLVGASRVRFRPVGTIVIGADGRVDMLCGTRTRLIAHVDGGWHFVERSPLRQWLVDEESFSHELREMLAE